MIKWRVGVEFDDDGNETQYFQVVSENTLNCLAHKLDEASASLIVTALNSHDTLVEALERAAQYLYNPFEPDKQSGAYIEVMDALKLTAD